MAAVLVVIYIPCDTNNKLVLEEVGGYTEQIESSSTNEHDKIEGGGEDTVQESKLLASDPAADTPSPGEVESTRNESDGGGVINIGLTNPVANCEEVPLLEDKGSTAISEPVTRDCNEETVKATQCDSEKTTDKKSVRIASDANIAQDEEADKLRSDSYSLEDAVQDLLDTLNVDNDVWVRADDQSVLQVSFVVPVENCDAILRGLTSFGLGSIPHTSITTFPATFHQVPKIKKEEEDEAESDGTTGVKKSKSFTDEKSRFMKSIKARLTVAQVVAAVEGNARITFDFIMLICLASLIAALGLVENSSVVLVASMLVSPLMGPILGWVFGFVIQNQKLTWIGVKNAFIGLVICLVVGFLLGLVVSGANSYSITWGSSDAWPTSEMSGRGLTRSLWVGVLIALPSGAGVAISVLGGNVGSLVGVAISASLLPPAVNAGILWAYSIVTAIVPPEVVATAVTASPQILTTAAGNDSLVNSTATPSSQPPSPTLYPPNCPALQGNTYQFVYSCSMAQEAAILGVVSLVLTLLNIVCIFLMGVLVLKIKEVAPHTTVSPVTEAFWKKDLPIARDCYKTLKGKDSLDAAKMAKDVAREWKQKHDDMDPSDLRKSWRYFVEGLEHSASIQNLTDLQPSTVAARRHTLMRSLSFQGHKLLHTDDDEDDDQNDEDVIGSASSPSSFFTPPSTLSSGLRHRNPFFYGIPRNPFGFSTPPTSQPDAKTSAAYATVQRGQGRRVPRHLKKQLSLSAESEKAILQSALHHPKKQGRFVVRLIPEEEEDASSVTGSIVTDKAPDTAQAQSATSDGKEVPFILKKPEKRGSIPNKSQTTSQSVAIEMGKLA